MTLQQYAKRTMIKGKDGYSDVSKTLSFCPPSTPLKIEKAPKQNRNKKKNKTKNLVAWQKKKKQRKKRKVTE